MDLTNPALWFVVGWLAHAGLTRLLRWWCPPSPQRLSASGWPLPPERKDPPTP